MATRSTAVTAAIAAGAALVATGITYASAASEPARSAPYAAEQAAVPAAALEGSNDNNSKGNEGREERHHRHYRERIGRIHINERDYPAIPEGCVTILSGLGSKSLNIINDSRRTVEVFSGVTCDNGAPIAIVGPFSQSDGVHPRHVHGGVKVKHGLVGSFRVICDHRGFGEGRDRCDTFEHGYDHNDHDYDDD